MKFSCQQKDFSTAVTNVQRAVSAKSNTPALEGILIKAEDNKITLCGYDLEIGITTFINCNVQEKGEVVVSAKLLGDIVRRLPENTVDIETDDRLIIYIKSGQAEYQIVGISSDEYPDLPNVDKMESISIKSSILKNMVKQTIFAISDDTSKPIYTGSLFDIDNNEFKIVSIDGYRMAIRKENINVDKTSRFVVPGKTQKIFSIHLQGLIDDQPLCRRNVKGQPSDCATLCMYLRYHLQPPYRHQTILWGKAFHLERLLNCLIRILRFHSGN